MSREALANLGVELWRLERRLQSPQPDHEKLVDSAARLRRWLGQLGVEIDDPISRTFVDGSTLEVIDAPPEAGASELVVVDVMRPTVFVDQVCALNAQVILGPIGQGKS